MSTLTNRAERALLGAMLRDPGLAHELGYVQTADFELARHRMVHTAIRETAGSRDTDRPWTQAVAARAGADAPLDYLDELGAACPDPLHGRAYAALVLEASFQRTMRDLTADASATAETIGYDAARLADARSPAAFTATRLAGDADYTARAISVHAARFDPGAMYAPAGPAAPARGQPAHDEELLLRALVAGHPATPRVLALVRPAAFTDPLRRDVFTAVRAADAAGHALDPLTVDWELGRLQARRGDRVPEAGSGEPSYVTRLARARPAGEKVMQAARLLAARQPSRTPAPVPAQQPARPALIQPPRGTHVDGQTPGPRR